MALLTSILKNESHRHPLLILQSSLAQSSLPVLRRILVAQDTSAKGSPLHNVLFCLLYQPSNLTGISSLNSVEVYDWTDRVPGYGESDYWAELLSVVEKGML
jgi:elongator complex protein 5